MKKIFSILIIASAMASGAHAALTPTQLDSLKSAADAGNMRAQYELGIAYTFGDGTDVDQKKANQYFRQAAMQGDPTAQFAFWLTNHMLSFTGKSGDEKEIIESLKSSADQGHHRAQALYAREIFTSSAPQSLIDEGLSYFNKAAEAGDPVALDELMEIYRDGRRVPQDEATANEYALKAAEAGNAYDYKVAGIIYFYGNGVPVDKKKAIEWWEKAWEELNDSEAAQYIGYCYQSGDGVPADREMAIKWYKNGASKGNNVCVEVLNDLGVRYIPER